MAEKLITTFENILIMDPSICPRCGTKMIPSRVPYHFEGKYFIGVYDGERCPMCGFILYTEKDYDKMIRDTQKFIKSFLSRVSLPVRLEPITSSQSPKVSSTPVKLGSKEEASPAVPLS